MTYGSKLISLIALALCLSFSAFAQNDAIDLARQQQELNSVLRKIFEAFSNEQFDNVIYDCLKIRNNRQLCEWSYLQMLDAVANTFYPNNPNEQQLLLSYLFLQSGYRMRLASDQSNIFMLYASKHILYDQPSFFVDGYYYYSLKNSPASLYISQASFPGEQALSLWMNQPQDLDYNAPVGRTMTSVRGQSTQVYLLKK